MATGALALLYEEEFDLQRAALEQLDEVIDTDWVEVAEELPRLQEIADDTENPENKLAALVASKTFFHLQNYDSALNYALGAGDKFNMDQERTSLNSINYVDKVIEKCIDTYKNQKQGSEEHNPIMVDERLEGIVNRMFTRSLNAGEYKQAMGIALETRRLDILKQAILESGNVQEMIEYGIRVANNVITSRNFRLKLLDFLVNVLDEAEGKKEGESTAQYYFSLKECLVFLNKGERMAKLLSQLLASTNKRHVLIAYQIGFDLQDRAPQRFVKELVSRLEGNNPDAMVDDEEEDDVMGDDDVIVSDDVKERTQKLLKVLSGTISIEYYLDFLYRRNETDLNILYGIKNSFDKAAIPLHATIIANAYMHAGTSVDVFLRDNLDWLKHATNWAKFSATASLGVIHKGNIKDSRTILEPYLPRDDNQEGSSVYSEGGSLYGLGLIHSNHGGDVMEYLRRHVMQGEDKVILHGACLGLGLTALATENEELFDELLGKLYDEKDAVAGEGIAITIGLVMLGSGNLEAAENLLTFSREVPHEKKLRGIVLAIAMIVYGCEEAANKLIETMKDDKDPIVRYGAMYMLGMAYCGTSNNYAIRNLLQVAVSDVSDDVRRAAVTNLGFILFKNPKQVPRLVVLLGQSYNPHVRYGVAMALGIACAGTGLKEAIDILSVLAEDPVDYVQQGAFIALSMILNQLNKHSVDENGEKIGDMMTKYRDMFKSTYTKRNLIMKKLGAILASGIIDAGGRNVTICLHKNGHNKMRNVVGLMMFTQYWFWYPYLHFLSLAFEPTTVIGLNEQFKMPKVELDCQARPSLYAYPEKVAVEQKEEKKVGPRVALSVSRKTKKAKVVERDADAPPTPRSPDSPLSPFDLMSDDAYAPSTAKKETKKSDDHMVDEKEEKVVAVEPSEFKVANPARVTVPQLAKTSFSTTGDYVPMKEKPELGIVLLDYIGDGEETFVEMKSIKRGDEEVEAPPADFTWP
mmetsp:Transcript_8885/g.13195  ORF Transcript_8885/g.13195 Transcript_8885/m.13195 type:complete len:977 (-) Transcript_8885:2177-5107(-)